MAVSKGIPLGASAISDNPLKAASIHDVFVSGMFQKADILKQVIFQDSALLGGLQKIDEYLKSVDNDLYALRAERNDRPTRQYKSLGRSKYRNRNWSRNIS